MSEQPKERHSSPRQIVFSLPSLLAIFLAAFLSLTIIISPATSCTNLFSPKNRQGNTQPVAKNTPAWVTMDNTGIYASPASFLAIAHANRHTPISLTGSWQQVDKMNWAQVMWHTGAQSHTGWIQANALTTQTYSGISSASIGMLSGQLQDYLSDLGPAVGVAVYIPSTNQYYLYNGRQEFPMASSMKIPIMLTMIDQVEQQNRPLMDSEAQLLEAMIESSDNDAADSLYQEIDTVSGVNSFLYSHNLSGILPDANTWGTSTASPQAMAHLLAALFNGELLSDSGTSYALSLMQNIAPDQRFGVGDTAPQKAIVSMKDGWLALDQGWAVNSSGIVQTTAITYIVSVYTVGRASQEAGMQILNTTCQQIVTALM